jgi:GR25 family glycosyltransferase involved in LPS biosynthesis
MDNESSAMRIEESFPLIVCLNLDRRPDRRLRAWEQFSREELSVERLSAPDAAEMSRVSSRRYEKAGPRACAVAHRMAWREARKRGAPAVLVFEDDVILTDGFRRKLELWLASVPHDWRILYLGGVFRDPPTMIAPGLLRVTGRTWDMHAYAVHANAIPGLNRAVAPLSWPQTRGTVPSAVPQALDTVIPVLHQDLPTYAPWPPLAWQPLGLSNNEIARRGNYRADGQQNLLRDAVAHLPALAGC